MIQDHARARNLDSRSPDTASFEDIRRFQLHVAASGVGVGVINRTASALRFFFRVTLGRYAIVEHTHFIHEPRKLARMMGGDVTVTSEPGKGSVFTVCRPVGPDMN